MASKYLRTRDVMQRYGVSKTWVSEMVKARNIPFTRIGKRAYFNEAALEEWERDNTVLPDAAQA